MPASQWSDPAGNADRSDYSVTEVRYANGAENQAQVRRSRTSAARASSSTVDAVPAGANVVIVLGRDFDQVKAPATTVPSATHHDVADRRVRTSREPRRRPDAAGCGLLSTMHAT